jgi:mRNA interferase RelE/StbE
VTSGSDQQARRHEVRLARRAVRSLAELQRRDQQRIRAAIDLLADQPQPPNCVALQGESGVYRVRAGDYRIVYEVFDRLLVSQVVRFGHRREVVRWLSLDQRQPARSSAAIEQLTWWSRVDSPSGPPIHAAQPALVDLGGVDGPSGARAKLGAAGAGPVPGSLQLLEQGAR